MQRDTAASRVAPVGGTAPWHSSSQEQEPQVDCEDPQTAGGSSASLLG